MNLHYTCTDEQLEERLDQVYRRWARVESQLDSAKEEKKRTGRTPVDYNTLQQRWYKYSRIADKMEEELYWRADPQGVISDYTKAGYKLQYIAGNGQFDTYEEALSEANYYVMRNGVIREYGPDDEYIPDILSPEDMVTIVFVPTRIGE